MVNDRAPEMAIGRPQAEEVATACCIGTLRQLRKGTVAEPPPMPKIAEAQADHRAGQGRSRPCRAPRGYPWA
ncbi:hypothetical protein [Pseudomonas aeruginosa]|uniref:hypothetical protein n=1 Tax=Pseudomonas aeruginosa TaxID=287 RepID=UPI003D7C7DFB